MTVNKVLYKHFEVKVSPAAAHAVDALFFGCGKINNDLNPDYNADLVNSVAFRASECTITRVVRKNADDESTVLYDGTPVNHFYLEYEPEDENDNGLFSITVKKTDGTDAMKVVTVPYGTNRRPVYATQDEALRARMTTAEDDIDALETRMATAEDDIDDLETRMATAEDDIDDLETKVDTIEQTTIPAITDNVEALQANMLPKTGGSMTGRLGIDPGLIPYMIGETANVYQDIMSWYTGLDANTVGIAQIRPTQAAVGLQVNWGLILACKRSDTNGVMLAMQYAGGGVLFSYVDDSGLHDFSVSGQTTASA